MSNADRTARAAYTEDQIVRDGALALRIDEPAFRAWMVDDRRLTLEMVAVQLFLHSENYSQRAMRIRAAILDLPPIEEDDYTSEG